MNFGDVFSKAWNTVWKNKILWIFGFFASLLGMSNNGGDNNGFRWDLDFNYVPEELPRIFNNYGNYIESIFESISKGEWIAITLGMIALGIIVFLVSMFFGHLGRGAAIRGAVLANDDSKLKFGPLFKEGLKYFWKLLAVTGLLIAAIIAGTIVVIILSVVTLGIGALIFVCLLLPIMIGVALLIIQTTIFIVAEDEGVFDAIQHAWNFVFEQHLGNYLLMGVILFVGAIIASLVIALPLLIMGVPTALALFSGEGFTALGIVMGIIAVLIYLPFYIAAEGLVTSFTWAAWTYFYQDLIGEDAKAEEELELLSLEGGLPGEGEMLSD